MTVLDYTQAEIGALLRKISTEYTSLNEKQRKDIIREFRRILSDTNDLLLDYAESDGTIKRIRVNRLLREYDGIERDLRDIGIEAFEKNVKDTSDWTTKKVAAILGISVTAADLLRLRNQTIRNVFNREIDELNLSDRVWSTSADIRSKITEVIRRSIIRGEGVQQMIPKIRKVHENETWKIERLARTELLAAYRSTILENAKQSRIIGWVEFHEGTCGRKDHASHTCYSIARENPYGKGQGIYKPSDTRIISPHPQCTSWISYVVE